MSTPLTQSSVLRVNPIFSSRLSVSVLEVPDGSVGRKDVVLGFDKTETDPDNTEYTSE